MSQLFLTRSQSRQVDERAVHQWGISSLVLMENAGRGAADHLCRLDPNVKQVSIFCGKGNNGGDGLVMARHLHLRGLNVQVLVFHDPQTFSVDTLTNFQVLQACGISSHLMVESSPSIDWKAQLKTTCRDSDWLVDALLGTGSTGPPRSPLDQVIVWMNQADAQRISLDVPSGLDCDTAEIASIAVRANQTFTFAAAKPGLLVPSAAEHVGHLEVCDIGLPRKLIESCMNNENGP